MQELRSLYPFTTVAAESFTEAHMQINPTGNQSKATEQMAAHVSKVANMAEDIVGGMLDLLQSASKHLYIKASKYLPDVKKTKHVILTTQGEEKFMLVTSRTPVRYDMAEKKRTVQILFSELLRFDKAGNFKGAIETATHIAKLDHDEVVKRLSVREDLGDSPYLLKRYASVEYRGKHGAKVAFCEERAHSDLWGFLCGLEAYDEGLMLSFAKDVVEAVRFVHSKSYVHKDIKADNFLLVKAADGRRYRVTISDFGYACKVSDEEGMKHRAGTLDWFAPEVLTGNSQTIGQLQDLWGVGLILYCLSGIRRKAPIYVAQEAWADAYEVFASCQEDKTREKLKVEMDRKSALWRTALTQLARPKEMATLQQIAELFLQRVPEERLSLDRALTGIHSRIQLHDLEGKVAKVAIKPVCA